MPGKPLAIGPGIHSFDGASVDIDKSDTRRRRQVYDISIPEKPWLPPKDHVGI